MATLRQTKSFALTTRLWPEAAQREGGRLREAVETVVQLLYLLPFAAAGLIWLLLRTNYTFLFENLDRLVILFAVMFLLLLQPFDVRVRLGREGEGLQITTSFAPLVMWSALFISGAAGLWAMVFASAAANLWRAMQLSRYGQNPLWPPLSTFVQQMSVYVFATLIAAELYLAAGGAFPITSADAAQLVPALVTAIGGALLSGLVMLPAGIQLNSLYGAPNNLSNLGRFYLGAVALPLIMSPFAIIITLLNIEGRLVVLAFVLAGVYLVNRLAHYMSKANARSRQQAREFAELEALGEAIIESPPDASGLPQVLADHLPRLFPVERVEIRLFEPQAKVAWSPFRVAQPAAEPPVPQVAWDKLQQSDKGYVLLPDVVLPGDRTVFGDALAVKIMSEQPGSKESQPRVIGGVALLRHRSAGKTIDSLAATQSLASQVGSAVYRAEVFAETLAFQKAQQELEFAGRIQTSFLPAGVPRAENWQISAVLDSARQTSGDFYDFIPLDDGLIGLIMADVSDKGTGAALYMALSRTLIRTYAMEEGLRPEVALSRANDRIRADAESNQFVTLIYGILDPRTGVLVYANAGHNPGYLLRAGDEAAHETLSKTGIPLGMFEGMAWEQAQTQIEPGDVLLLYTDGVTEAQNAGNEEYGDDRLLRVGRENMSRPAAQIQEAVMRSIGDFVAEAPQFDDITLMVVARNATA
jgi:serine phosphatase RsbU (regulator of sigma subunit)